MVAILDAACLEPNVPRWIAAMYSNIKSFIKINGFFSTPFRTERSVREGYPLSPLLYMLSLEPLLRKVDEIRKTPVGPWHGRGALEYKNDVNIILLDVG